MYQRECWDRQIARENQLIETAKTLDKERQEKFAKAQQAKAQKYEVDSEFVLVPKCSKDEREGRCLKGRVRCEEARS